MQPAPSIELPHQEAEYVSHIALDIGGSLVKLVYFSPDPHDVSPGRSTADEAKGEHVSSSPSAPPGLPSMASTSRGGAWAVRVAHVLSIQRSRT